jgi:hypothetical protein
MPHDGPRRFHSLFAESDSEKKGHRTSDGPLVSETSSRNRARMSLEKPNRQCPKQQMALLDGAWSRFYGGAKRE